jgi:heme exporter protein A
VTAAHGDASIEARRLTKRFGGTTVLQDISFTVPAGAKVALTGANGAGKTTLLAVLSTLAAASAGEATVAGHSVANASEALRRSVGVLTHRPMLYEELTPQENLRFFARLYGVPDGDVRVEELLRAVGLWRRRDEPTGVLSRGTHQRLAIARALVHAPSVLLLDEPETGLDTDGIEVLDALMLCAPGMTVLAATHRIDRIDAWADVRLHLERGRLAADGVRELVAGTVR